MIAEVIYLILGFIIGFLIAIIVGAGGRSGLEAEILALEQQNTVLLAEGATRRMPGGNPELAYEQEKERE